MSTQLAPHNMSLPPPRAAERSSAPLPFVSKLIFSTIATVLGAAVIWTAPATVTIPITIVLVAGIAASGVIALVGRWKGSMRELGWLAVGAASIATILLALIVPDDLEVGFAAVGLAGLVVFRLMAAWVGWGPDRGPAPDVARRQLTARYGERGRDWRRADARVSAHS